MTSVSRRRLLSGAAAIAAVPFLSASGLSAYAMDQTAAPRPPVARKEPKRIEQVGRVRIDDYAWMKDENWQTVLQDPGILRADIRSHLEAENAYTEALLRTPTKDLQQTIFKEMRGRIKEDDSTVPENAGPFAYYSRFETGGQHPIFARRPRDGGDEEVLLNADDAAKGLDYYNVSAAEHAPDHALWAYSVDTKGAGFYELRVRDLATKQDLAEPMPNASGSFAWTPDSAFIFWIQQDDNARPVRLYRRPARGGVKDDVLVYEETDPGLFLGVDRSAAGNFIIITSANRVQSEVRIIPAATPDAAPRVIAPRRADFLYDVEEWNGRFVIRTDKDGAFDLKLMTAPADAPEEANWTDLVPHRPGTVISTIIATERYLVRLERANALPRIVVRGTDGAEHAVAFEEEAFALGLLEGYEYATPLLRFVYQSPSTPRQWFDYDMTARTRTLLKTQEVPSGHDPKAYAVKRITAKAADGAEVPVTILMKAGQAIDGSAPLLLYGYGSYGIPEDADFRISRFSLVDRGVIFAIAHVRGGSDKGRGWYLDGKLAKKMNTFTDFVAAGEALVAQRYTRAGRIVAMGGSAGGLLVGAAVNLAPALFSGVVAVVPFVDVINTMSDTSLPLTPPEWPEWGNPLESATDYDTIAAYCPYTNVDAKAYPAIFAICGLTDSRVTYWEAAKWVARLRDKTTGDRPILLWTHLEAGHGGPSGRLAALEETAFAQAFALKAFGHPDAGSFAPVLRG